MLTDITPLILTYNEEENIARTLDKLIWANEVVVLDSDSTDKTHEICKRYPNVRLVIRKFDAHAIQWNFGIKETDIKTDWILALDADYVLSNEYINELALLRPEKDTFGYWSSFKYCIFGKPLSGSLYPSVITLFRRDVGEYIQDGHTQRLIPKGNIQKLNNHIYHDDRKSLSRWLISQDRYAKLECDHLTKSSWSSLRWQDRIRKLIIIAPLLVLFYCLFIRKGILDGRAGIFYALQRMIAETILSLKMIEDILRNQ